MYDTKSACDKGSLFQLRNVLSRSAISQHPDKNMKAHEDFFLVILHSYIIVAAEELVTADSQDGCNCLDVASKVVSKWVKCLIPPPQPLTSCDENSLSEETRAMQDNNASQMPLSSQQSSESQEESIHTGMSPGTSYATDVITLGLLWHGFHDSVKEGDGDRILLYWKFLLPIFQQTKHYNYAGEAFNLLAQSLYLSPRKCAELKWGRTINTHGRAGQNIPCDLHMEHLNRRLKMAIRSSGANIVHPSTIQRLARSIGPVSHVCQQFEKELGLLANKDYHSTPSFKKEFNTIVSILRSERLLSGNHTNHRSFHKEPLLLSFNWEKLRCYVKDKIKKLDNS